MPASCKASASHSGQIGNVAFPPDLAVAPSRWEGRFGGHLQTPIACARSPTIERPAGAGTAGCDCALGGAGHRVARVGGCFPSRPAYRREYPSIPLATRPTPSVFPSSTAVSGRAQGEAGGERCPSTLAGKLKSAPPPGGRRNSLGVGRVARRARLAAKPFSRPLPRLTLKAGHKEGLPTTPTAVFGATKRRPSSPSPF